MMRLDRIGRALVLAAGLAVIPGCVQENEAAPASGTATAGVVKGGDDRNGDYDAPANWWKAAADHQDGWTWGEVSGLAADGPDRIIVAVWGDRNAQNQPRPDGSNYLVVVNR